ncbi:ATP-binding protein [Desulfuromonas thiophila]|uniref:ATP-binding protein n=1 Tax=Desulfuromonas thiophila TaxID=57664 RepID=UPI0029F4AFE3|nr:ATP-binding protein [Desulfuromonas thiophila]
MILQNTIEKMYMLKLQGMAKAFDEQLSNPSYADLSFEDRVSMLIDREETHRENERMKRLLQQAKFRHPSACIEDVDLHHTERFGEKSNGRDLKHDMGAERTEYPHYRSYRNRQNLAGLCHR